METWTQQRARLESAAETLQSEPIGQAIRAALSRLDDLERFAADVQIISISTAMRVATITAPDVDSAAKESV